MKKFNPYFLKKKIILIILGLRIIYKKKGNYMAFNNILATRVRDYLSEMEEFQVKEKVWRISIYGER